MKILTKHIYILKEHFNMTNGSVHYIVIDAVGRVIFRPEKLWNKSKLYIYRRLA